jgi:hypothetical protein
VVFDVGDLIEGGDLRLCCAGTGYVDSDLDPENQGIRDLMETVFSLVFFCIEEPEKQNPKTERVL